MHDLLNMIFAHFRNFLLLFLDALKSFLVDVLAISLRLFDHWEYAIDLAQDIRSTNSTGLLPLSRRRSTFHIILWFWSKCQKALGIDSVFAVSKLHVLFALPPNKIILLHYRQIMLRLLLNRIPLTFTSFFLSDLFLFGVRLVFVAVASWFLLDLLLSLLDRDKRFLILWNEQRFHLGLFRVVLVE